MFLIGSDSVFDFSLQLLREQLEMLEQQLLRLNETIDRSEEWAETMDESGIDRAPSFAEDPDFYLEPVEGVLGLAVIACQVYIYATYPQISSDLRRVLKCGPEAGRGRFLVDVLHAAANMWKHSSEWRLEGNQGMKRRALEVLRPLGVTEDTAYPLIDLIFGGPARPWTKLRFLADALEGWRDAARALDGLEP